MGNPFLPVPIIRWSDGTHMRRGTVFSKGVRNYDSVLLTLFTDLDSQDGERQALCGIGGPLGPDGWPALPMRNYFSSTDTGNTPAYLYDVVVALGLLDKLRPMRIPVFGQWTEVYYLSEYNTAFRCTGPGPTWEWAHPGLVPDEVSSLLGLPPPALLPWPNFCDLVGLTLAR